VFHSVIEVLMQTFARLSSRCVFVALGWALAASAMPVLAEEGYGTFKGTIKYDGAIPKRDPVVAKGDPAARDAAVCAAADVPDESLVVDPKSKGIQNVFVYLKKATTIHPDLKKSAQPDVTFDQKGCRFLPHALIVRTDQTVKVLSGDAIAHNTRVNTINNTPNSVVIGANDRKGVPFKETKPESLPTQVKCDFHGWMTAYWLILDHPYAAVTDKDGKFTIDKLPAGEYQFVIWQEQVGYLNRAYKVTITSNKTTEADLKFGPDKFKK
jgi:hypothetical protein